jgi:hypothetical protein
MMPTLEPRSRLNEPLIAKLDSHAKLFLNGVFTNLLQGQAIEDNLPAPVRRSFEKVKQFQEHFPDLFSFSKIAYTLSDLPNSSAAIERFLISLFTDHFEKIESLDQLSIEEIELIVDIARKHNLPLPDIYQDWIKEHK